MAEQLRIEGYVDACLVVDGALEDEEMFLFGEGAKLDDWLKRVKGEAGRHPDQHTAVYLMNHDHSPDVEDCECGQFILDMRPFWEIGRPTP